MTAELVMNIATEETNPKVVKILAGAREIFFQHGFGAATTDMVQQAAGVSKSTVYSYFPSKDALFVAVVRAECGKLVEGVHRERIKAQTPRETLLHMGMRLFETILDPPVLSLLRIVIAEAPRFPDLGRTVREAGALPMLRELADYLGEATRRGDLQVDEPGSAARHFVGMALHDIHMECLLGMRPVPDEGESQAIVERAVEAFLRAYATL